MNKLLLFVFASLIASPVFAKKSCTDQPKDKWMSVKDFKAKMVEMGYTIKKFKQPGTCYEIYGNDKEGKKVEIYFNPVDASIVEKED